MAIDQADLHVAGKKLQLKNTNYFLSFLSTLWKGEVILCCFNNVSNSIDTVYSKQEIEGEDLKQLEMLIKKFLNKQ
jgi:hypothetical protein